MQTLYAKLIANQKEIYNVLKWATVPIVIGVLYYQLFVKIDYLEAWEVFQKSLSGETFLYFALSCILMPVNLGIEAVKWRLLIQKLHSISLQDALKSIFAGISLSIFTPKRIGEYAGRVLLLKQDRKNAVLSLFIGNLSQGLANLILGLLSFIFYFQHNQTFIKNTHLLLIGSIVLIILFSILYFNLKKIITKFQHISFFKKYKESISVVYRYHFTDLIKLLGLSLLKYIVFIAQFVFIILAFNIDIELFWGMISASCVFFIKTMLPIPASVELAARGSIAISFFEVYTNNHIGILVASILLWIINLAIPALIGSVYVSKTKL